MGHPKKFNVVFFTHGKEIMLFHFEDGEDGGVKIWDLKCDWVF